MVGAVPEQYDRMVRSDSVADVSVPFNFRIDDRLYTGILHRLPS